MVNLTPDIVIFRFKQEQCFGLSVVFFNSSSLGKYLVYIDFSNWLLLSVSKASTCTYLNYLLNFLAAEKSVRIRFS